MRCELVRQGWTLGEASAQILPLFVGDAKKTMALTQALLDEGLYVQGIRPPTVPAGTCRLRLAVSAGHTDDHVKKALESLTFSFLICSCGLLYLF